VARKRDSTRIGITSAVAKAVAEALECELVAEARALLARADHEKSNSEVSATEPAPAMAARRVRAESKGSLPAVWVGL